MGGCKLIVFLYITLFITVSYAGAFRTMNDFFEPYFWESKDWRCRNALELCHFFELLKPEYAQSISSSGLEETKIISDLTVLNHLPNAKTELIQAQRSLLEGIEDIRVFTNPICIDYFSQASRIIVDCDRRGGRLSTSGCRVKEENETVTYQYRIEAVCVFDYLSMSGKYKDGLTNYFDALTHTSKSMNFLYSEIDKEFTNLDNLGAGYENYFGQARPLYLKAKQVNDALILQETMGINPNLDSISFQYSKTHDELVKIREEIIDNPKGPNFEFLKLLKIDIESMAGRENSLVHKGIELYDSIILAKELIISEWTELRFETINNKRKAEDSLRYLNSEKLDLVDTIPAEYIIPIVETPENINPDEYLIWELTNVYYNLHIIKDEADTYFNRVNHYGINSNHNLGEGIEKLTFANNRYKIIEYHSEFLLYEFDELNEWMKTKANEKLNECNSKLENTTQSSRAFALVYKEEADTLSKVTKNTIGEQYQNSLAVYEKARQCVEICDGNEILMSFDSLLGEFNRVISKAESDKLEVSKYRDWYRIYSSYNYEMSNIIFIEQDIRQFINEIYELADLEYGQDLTSKRLIIKSKIYNLYSYDKSLKNEKDTFEKWEVNYNRDGTINYQKALGNLNQMRNDYNRILDSFEFKTPEILKLKFQQEYIIQENWKEIPILDETVNLEINVIFRNPTELSTEDTVILEIPFQYEVYNSDVIFKSDNIRRISKNGNNLLIEFSKIEKRDISELRFKLETKLFRKFSHSETILEETNEYQKIGRIIIFEADIDVDILTAFEEIPEDVVSCYTEINGISRETINTGSQAKIKLTDIEKGRRSYNFYYIIENRIFTQNLSEGNYQNEYDNIIKESEYLNEIIELFENNNLTEQSKLISNELIKLDLILEDSQKDYNLGKYADAFDKLKKARNITQSFDLFSSLESLRTKFSEEFNSLNSVWIRSGQEDFETTLLMAQIEENLVKLRSLTLSKEDIPLIGKTNELLNILRNSIGHLGQSTLTEISNELIYAKSISNDFENHLYPKYRIYYNSLRTYKVEGNTLVNFPYTLTDLDAKLKSVKRIVIDMEKRIDDDPYALLDDMSYLSSFRESIKEFNITKNGVEAVVNEVPLKTEEYISKTEQGIILLNSKSLNADSRSKLDSIEDELNKAKDNFEKENFIDSFKISSKIYYDTLRLLSANTDTKEHTTEGEFPILIVFASLFLLFGIGGLFYISMKKKPEEEKIVFKKLERDD